MAIINIESHTPTGDKNYFFDCMIWMYLCSPHGEYNSSIIKKYSKLQGRIIHSGANILINDVLISEFSNTFIRKQFHLIADEKGFPKTSDYFKYTFKATEDYKKIIFDLKSILEKEIFTCTQKIDGKFSSLSLDRMFDYPETFDFNDKYYGLNFENEPVYIVTHDADFANVPNCDIISANLTLINATQAVSPIVASDKEEEDSDIIMF